MQTAVEGNSMNIQKQNENMNRESSEAFAALLASLSEIDGQNPANKEQTPKAPEPEIASNSSLDPHQMAIDVKEEKALVENVVMKPISSIEGQITPIRTSEGNEFALPKKRRRKAQDEDDEDYDDEGEDLTEEEHDELKNAIEVAKAAVVEVELPPKKDEDTHNFDKIISFLGEKRKRSPDDDWKPGMGKKKHRGRKKNELSPTPSFSPLPDTPTSPGTPKKMEVKLSFQEAAVRVLNEQRQKGIYALSTRKIWELISQTGLVDTKCKTPVSSLSSRITEDVRTKGNKSVFLRVGEGLYTLRKGLKKQELERYLAQKYPHMSHSLESESKSDHEEEREEKITPLPALEPQWIGLPLKTKKNGDLYYSAVKVGKYKFRLGDAVYFTPNADDQLPYIGKIAKLWETNKLDAPESGKMFVQCVWYYYPEDTQLGRTKKHHKNQVFLSDSSDVNTVDRMLSPVEVVSFDEYNNRVNSGQKKERKDLFFCRSFYSENTKNFHSLEMDPENNHYHIEDFKEGDQIPSNWPESLQYTSEVIFQNVPEMIKDYLQSPTLQNVELRVIDESSHSIPKEQQTETEIEPKDDKSEVPKESKEEEDLEDKTIGLFAKKELPVGTIVGEYVGKLKINSEQFEDKEGEENKEEDGLEGSEELKKYCRSLYDDDEVSVSIDARHAGNELRFIRQVTDKPSNVKFSSVQLNGKWRLLVTTTSDVKVGDELVTIPM